MVECPVGSCAPYLAWTSIAASGICRKKSVFQSAYPIPAIV
jgi:hypothetical protein